MSRWEPEGGARLQEAAIELFLEHGYDNVTVAQIADRAGLTRRTFSRYFADKRDVLFAGSDELPSVLADALRHIDRAVPPFEAMLRALTDVAGVLEGRITDLARQRRAIIAGSPELKERGHAKFAAVADALATALSERGVDSSTSALLADVGVAVFRAGFESWVEAPEENDLALSIRQAAQQLILAASPTQH